MGPRAVATIFIPSTLRSLTRGAKEVTIQAANVGQVVNGLEQMYPGIKARLVEEGQIRPDISVVIDGEASPLGLLDKVGEDSEIHFIPAIGGG